MFIKISSHASIACGTTATPQWFLRRRLPKQTCALCPRFCRLICDSLLAWSVRRPCCLRQISRSRAMCPCLCRCWVVIISILLCIVPYNARRRHEKPVLHGQRARFCLWSQWCRSCDRWRPLAGRRARRCRRRVCHDNNCPVKFLNTLELFLTVTVSICLTPPASAKSLARSDSRAEHKHFIQFKQHPLLPGKPIPVQAGRLRPSNHQTRP